VEIKVNWGLCLAVWRVFELWCFPGRVCVVLVSHEVYAVSIDDVFGGRTERAYLLIAGASRVFPGHDY